MRSELIASARRSREAAKSYFPPALLCTGLFFQIVQVITESMMKAYMKAILRKLRLQNRTQAAIWARTHLGELLGNAA